MGYFHYPTCRAAHIHQGMVIPRYTSNGSSPWNPKCSFTRTKDDIFSMKSNITLDGHTLHLPAPPLSFYEQSGRSRLVDIMTLGNYSLDMANIKQTAVCQPSKEYQWGFSTPLLLLFCLATIFFATILVALHTDNFLNSRVDRFSLRV